MCPLSCDFNFLDVVIKILLQPCLTLLLIYEEHLSVSIRGPVIDRGPVNDHFRVISSIISGNIRSIEIIFLSRLFVHGAFFEL